MSGNYDSEELLDGSREASSAEGSAEGEDGSVLVNSVDSPNQIERIDQDDGVLVMGVDTIQDEQNEEKVVEDGGKDDMFVDCPDELVSYDGRIGVVDNIEATDTSESRLGFVGYNASFDMLDKGRAVDDLTSELEHLRAMLEKTVGEKESFARESEAERRTLAQGLANLHHQLRALSTQGYLVTENDSGYVDHYDSENWMGEKSVVSDDTPLQDMINDCSKLVKHAVDDRSKTQGTISEIHSMLHKKDQEIQELSARVSKSSVQQETEAIANRVLSCLASAFTQEELSNESFAQKMCHIESASLFLIEKYTSFLYETDLLRQCITNVRSDHVVPDDVEAIFFNAREELIEVRRKEFELAQKVKEMEEKNLKQMEELLKGRETIDMANTEIQKTKVELEHERARFNNTKEKLSLAVTKGKALVQHRDSLKQSLADKTNELERCRIEIKEKTSALEAAELCKKELIKSEILAASLDEERSERNSVIESCERVLLESNLPQELQSIDILGKVQWLANEKNKLMGTLQDVTIITREAANKEIDRLTALILVETQEKHYLQEELEDLRYQYDQIVQKEYQNSLEKDRVVRLLHDVSGIAMYSAEGSPSDIGNMIEQCFGKLKDQTSASIESSHLEGEVFEKMQSLLYTRDQEAMLFEEILEEERLKRSEVNQLVNKVAVVSQELSESRDENDSLRCTLSRSEEKATVLREKLSMAVKKGKGLVQERENLKQLLDRTKEIAHNDIDRLTASILTETQKNNYLLDELEDLRYKYKEIVGRERQVSLEKNRLVKMLHEASGIAMNNPEEPHSDMDNSVDRCFGKLREQNRVSTESVQVDWKLLERIQNLLYTRDLEAMLFEIVLEDDMLDRSQFNDLTNKISVLSQELHDLKDEKDTLQNLLSHSEEKTIILREDLSSACRERTELVQDQEDIKQLVDNTREAAQIEIDRLTLAVLAETQEKHYFEEVFEDLRYKYGGILEKEHQISMERDRVVRKLQEASGMALNDPEELHSGMDSVIDQCLVKLKEKTQFPVECCQVENKIVKKIQCLLYIRDFEAMLFETLLEEEMLNKSEVNHLTNKMAVISEELQVLKDEKSSLRNDLSRSEEKASLLREKLSLAVKKGKGLVQERENLKQLLDERNASIENLKLELEQQELSLTGYKTEVHKLSSVADCVPKLEFDLNAIKEERNQLEQFLAKSNRMLQRLIGSIESITFLDGTSVEEPAEKVQRLVGYINECEAAKEQAQHELELVKEEIATKFNELALADTKIHMLVNEKEDAQVIKFATEAELQKVKEASSYLNSELAEARKTIKSLEDAMSQAQTNLSLLAEENNLGQLGRTNLESEIEKLKQVAGMQARELADASSNLKSYEEAIHKVENTMSDLQGEKENAAHEIENLKSRLNTCMQELGDRQNSEQEISNLKSQLNACMQELAATGSAKGIGSPELYGHLSSLQSLMKEESTLPLLRQCFEKKIDGLKNIDHILNDINDHFNDMDLNAQQTLPISEEDLFALNRFPDDIHNIENIEMDGELTADDENFTSSIEKTVNNLQLKHKILADVCVRSSSFMDNLIASLSKKLVATRDEFLVVSGQMKALKKHMNEMEMDKQAQEHYMGTMVENLQNNLKESRTAFEKAVEERNIYQSRVCKLEADLEALEILCSEMRHKVGEHQAEERKWQEREMELTKHQRETEDPLLSAFQLKSLFKKIDGIKIPLAEFEVGELEAGDPDHVKKLFYIVDCVGGMQREMSSVSRNNELQQSLIKDQALEIEHLKDEASEYIMYKQDYENLKHDLAKGLENIMKKLAGNEVVGTQKTANVMEQLTLLEKLVTAIILESENSKSKVQELDSKILKTQEVVDELSSKVKFFEESKQGREASASSIQERGGFEAHLLPRSEISEIDDVGPLVNIPPAGPSNAHVRSLRKGSSDQLAINIDSESDRLISKKNTAEDKGHVFKSLNTSGLVPKQGRTIADRIDGIWVAGDRALMGRPRARIGVIAYWLFLNIWLLSYIL
ncbi:trans-Golgi network-localized SYP41-interacting protein 1-like [Apium graveolens]|uniref:trans-Golgi network-localized SYP41-interacting protein 1-like n=1 Tax=Apium graveolens TaxID=4045 RepID=UPI003D7ADBF0